MQGVDCDCVMVNNREASFNATELLINKGYKRIGCISGPIDRTTGIERLQGFTDALRKNGFTVDDNLIIFGDFSLESGRKKMEELIESSDIDSVFVANNDMATGAYQLIKEKNLKIPEYIGFIMFDDPIWATLVTPKINAISQPVYTLGSTAADLLFRRILEGRKYIDQKPVKVILEVDFIIRESA